MLVAVGATVGTVVGDEETRVSVGVLVGAPPAMAPVVAVGVGWIASTPAGVGVGAPATSGTIASSAVGATPTITGVGVPRCAIVVAVASSAA
jgi:hypothetical protein